MLTRAQKEETIGQLREKLARATSVFVADYRGLSVRQIDVLRGKLREPGEAESRVTKNSLLLRAPADSPAAGLAANLDGPTAVAFSFGDPVRLAKLLVDYAKDPPKIRLKGGFRE